MLYSMSTGYSFDSVFSDKDTAAFSRGQVLFSNGKVVFVQPMLLGADKIFVSKVIDGTIISNGYVPFVASYNYPFMPE